MTLDATIKTTLAAISTATLTTVLLKKGLRNVCGDPLSSRTYLVPVRSATSPLEKRVKY